MGSVQEILSALSSRPPTNTDLKEFRQLLHSTQISMQAQSNEIVALRRQNQVCSIQKHLRDRYQLAS